MVSFSFVSAGHLRVARIITIMLFPSNQYRPTAARAHIYRDRQSSMGNEEPSEKLIQQRGRGCAERNGVARGGLVSGLE